MPTDTNTYEKELKVAVQAVEEAARLCQTVQASIAPDALEKRDRSPVTVADFGSQALVCRLLKQTFGEDPVIAEEDSEALREEKNSHLQKKLVQEVNKIHPGARADEICSWIDHGGSSTYCQRFWTLDPIDGTKGFLRGDQYAISLALIVNGEPKVAALCCPNLPFHTTPKKDPDNPQQKGACFYAIKGQGTFGYSLDVDPTPVSVHTSPVEDTTLIRFCESFEAAHSSHEDAARIAKTLGIVADPVRIDSQAKYAVVAQGQAEAYLRLPRGTEYREKIWDHAGGFLVVMEAGGNVTDITGRPLDFTHGQTLKENRGVIVSNGMVHDAILNAIGTLGIG